MTSTAAKIIKLESEILVRFEGFYVHPKSVVSLSEDSIEIVTVSGPVPENPSAEPSKSLKQGADRMKIGTMKKSEKKTKGGDDTFSLKFHIPFLKIEDMWVLPNSKKEEGDKRPDMVLMSSGNLVGGLWKRSRTDGDTYLSGNIESLAFPSGKLDFAIFKEKDTEGKTSYAVVSSNKKPESSDSKQSSDSVELSGEDYF